MAFMGFAVTHVSVYDSNLIKLEEIYSALKELDDSLLVEEIGKELNLTIPDLMEGIQAYIGSLREYRDTTNQD